MTKSRRTDELKERGAARAEVSVASLLSELEDARLLALKLGQASAAVAATMGEAKITGHIIDRREVGDAGAFDDMTDEELISEPRARLVNWALPGRGRSRTPIRSASRVTSLSVGGWRSRSNIRFRR